MKSQQSIVQGHVHTSGGVSYVTSKNNRIFGMSVGCGINISEYAFVYRKHQPTRPILGCGIVVNGKDAYFIPMHLEEDTYSK